MPPFVNCTVSAFPDIISLKQPPFHRMFVRWVNGGFSCRFTVRKMKFLSCLAGCCLFLLLSQALAPGSTNTVHTTWLWHLHQPIYWPDRRNYGTDHYENAWDTIQQQNAGRPHPAPEVLSTIFGEADRVNAYQAEPGTAISGLLGYPNAGAQVNYSGALMENVQSLAAA